MHRPEHPRSALRPVKTTPSTVCRLPVSLFLKISPQGGILYIFRVPPQADQTISRKVEMAACITQPTMQGPNRGGAPAQRSGREGRVAGPPPYRRSRRRPSKDARPTLFRRRPGGGGTWIVSWALYWDYTDDVAQYWDYTEDVARSSAIAKPR